MGEEIRETRERRFSEEPSFSNLESHLLPTLLPRHVMTHGNLMCVRRFLCILAVYVHVVVSTVMDKSY